MPQNADRTRITGGQGASSPHRMHSNTNRLCTTCLAQSHTEQSSAHSTSCANTQLSFTTYIKHCVSQVVPAAHLKVFANARQRLLESAAIATAWLCRSRCPPQPSTPTAPSTPTNISQQHKPPLRSPPNCSKQDTCVANMLVTIVQEMSCAAPQSSALRPPAIA